jgi:hypothetical protein
MRHTFSTVNASKSVSSRTAIILSGFLRGKHRNKLAAQLIAVKLSGHGAVLSFESRLTLYSAVDTT